MTNVWQLRASATAGLAFVLLSAPVLSGLGTHEFASGAPISSSTGRATQAPTPVSPADEKIAQVIATIETRITQAQQELDAVTSRGRDLQAKLVATSTDFDAVGSQIAALDQQIRELDDRLAAEQSTLSGFIVDRYQRFGAVSSVLADDDIAGITDRDRRRHYSTAVVRNMIGIVRSVERERTDRASERDAANTTRRRLAAERARIGRDVTHNAAVTTRAERRVTAEQARLTPWKTIAAGIGTPIMGRSVLTSEQLADWFRSTRKAPNATVSLEELTRLFVSEGDIEGVRGDIAFAQSILETGSFAFPSGGQLDGFDNNFAGIGACDSCQHGWKFRDAQTGVRAQIHLLRSYADPGVTVAKLANPPEIPNYDRGSHGFARTWGSLTHRWATADAYGDRIMLIYVSILEHATGVGQTRRRAQS